MKQFSNNQPVTNYNTEVHRFRLKETFTIRMCTNARPDSRLLGYIVCHLKFYTWLKMFSD